jgi:hypothetical protein
VCTTRCPRPSTASTAVGDVATMKQPCGAMFWNDGEARPLQDPEEDGRSFEASSPSTESPPALGAEEIGEAHRDPRRAGEQALARRGRSRGERIARFPPG